MKQQDREDKDLFADFKEKLLKIDPITFCEKYLTLDGAPFTLHGNGYKPLADIYRYIGIKALEPNTKPIIITKGRQVGLTTTASALEMYFMGSGLFGGNSGRPPIRILHAFPQLEHAATYSKTKLSQMISQSKIIGDVKAVKGTRAKSYMQNLLDQTTATNESLHFKQFVGGNHMFVESTGIDADRIMGRQLCLETELPTPRGFIKLKNLKEGDELFDDKGNVCCITKLHPINFTPEAYRITFDDDTIVDACAEHLWLTYTKEDRVAQHRFDIGTRTNAASPKIKNTREILQTLRTRDNKENNHSIPNCDPLNFSEKDLPVDPYLLGLWLCDGSGAIESADPEIFHGLNYHVNKSSIGKITFFSSGNLSKSCAYRVKGITSALTKINQIRNPNCGFYNKHIPDNYMHGSFEQRLALLQGLLDTDGHCDKNGNIEFVQVREKLAKQVHELVLSLGIKAYIYKRDSWRYNDKYRIRFTTTLPVFRMKRKLERIKKCATNKSTHRFICKIESIDSKPMRCITVDSPSHLFLITRNCIATHNTVDIIFFDECQKISPLAIGNALKILTASKYGRQSKGVQIYFGTPRRKGSDFFKMWQRSSQQYYYLGCEACKQYFPLYTPGSDEWEKIWIHGYIVRCPHCNHEQNKLEAAERGKWIAGKDSDDSDCDMVGFHINQLYMPMFTREDIEKEKPAHHLINTERVFQNEVLGEFFQGDSSPITAEEIKELCGDIGRRFSATIKPTPGLTQQIAVLGIDYGARADLEQAADPDKAKQSGQSYSTAVVLLSKGPGLLSIEFCTKFKKNDPESKKGIIDQLMRQYNIQLAVGDIGFSNDFSYNLQMEYGDRYLVSRAAGKLNNYVKFRTDIIPKEIQFERDYYMRELFEQMKKGMIRFPFGDYERVAWLIDHCSSMELKPSISRTGGDPTIHYVKGGTPNDGFCALLNAYIAYKFLVSRGFTNNDPGRQNIDDLHKPLVIAGYVPRRI